MTSAVELLFIIMIHVKGPLFQICVKTYSLPLKSWVKFSNTVDEQYQATALHLNDQLCVYLALLFCRLQVILQAVACLLYTLLKGIHIF